MILSRHVNLPKNIKRVVNGPIAGGTFWGLHGANDAIRDPSSDPVAYGDVDFMTRNGSLWVSKGFLGIKGDVEWTPVTSVKDLPKFVISHRDDYEGCAVVMDVDPFLPQFYFVPKNRRGRVFIRRAVNRALGLQPTQWS